MDPHVLSVTLLHPSGTTHGAHSNRFSKKINVAIGYWICDCVFEWMSSAHQQRSRHCLCKLAMEIPSCDKKAFDQGCLV